MASFLRSLPTPVRASIPLLLGAAGPSFGLVTVTDHGLTTPTLTADDTGFTGTSNQRFGWDVESFSQSFTLADAGTLGSIYLGYNAFEDGDTLTFDLFVNDDLVQGGIVLDGNNFSGAAGDNNDGPFYWMEFDLSSLNVPLEAGTNSFKMTATANTGNSWALAPRYHLSASSYPGGELGGLPTTGDLAFAVTVLRPDVDGDGLTDDYELANTDPPSATALVPGEDDDGDGMTNEQEFHGQDSLGEVHGFGRTMASLADTDADGIDDEEELSGAQNPYQVGHFPGDAPGGAPGQATNPNDPDSDDDGILDGEEVSSSTDGFITNPNDDDTDGDGLKDGDEYDIHYSDPLLTDSDGDGLPDGEEVNTHGTDPGLFDSDDDGLDDGWEVTHVLDPNDNGDVDPVNGATGDPDEDDLDNFTEYLLGTNPRSGDSDTDGLTDGDEVLVHGTDPSLPDTDGDTLSDNDELTVHGTDPTQADSDGDGATDGDEIATGHEPGDPDDFPEFTTAVTWTSERELAGASDISLNGTQVAAYVFGPSDVEVALGSETIHFEHQGGNQGAFYTANGDSTGNPSLDLLLDNHSATAGQTPWRYQLAGLVPGQTYQIQIIAGADRRLATSFRRQRFGDGLGNLTGDLTRSGPGTAVGTFTAGELGKQVIDVLPGSGDPTAETTDPALTAIIVREVDASPVRVLSFSSGADDSELSISWISEPGTSYDVQSSPDLLDWSATVNESPVVATDTTSSLTFLKPASGQLFFRVVEK